MQGIDNRKDVLLLLLYLPGETGFLSDAIRGRTRLMKLIYLLEKEESISHHLKLEKFYDFENYDYGPFSSDVFDDIQFLRNVDLIASVTGGPSSEMEQAEDERFIDDVLVETDSIMDAEFKEEEYRLSPNGQKFVEQNLLNYLDPTLKEKIISLKKNRGSMSLSSLLKYVYSKFPESASKTKLRHLTS